MAFLLSQWVVSLRIKACAAIHNLNGSLKLSFGVGLHFAHPFLLISFFYRAKTAFGDVLCILSVEF